MWKFAQKHMLSVSGCGAFGWLFSARHLLTENLNILGTCWISYEIFVARKRRTHKHTSWNENINNIATVALLLLTYGINVSIVQWTYIYRSQPEVFAPTMHRSDYNNNICVCLCPRHHLTPPYSDSAVVCARRSSCMRRKTVDNATN